MADAEPNKHGAVKDFDSRPLLNAGQLVCHLKSRGVIFELHSETDAVATVRAH